MTPAIKACLRRGKLDGRGRSEERLLKSEMSALCVSCAWQRSQSFVTRQLVGWEVPEGTQGAGCNS